MSAAGTGSILPMPVGCRALAARIFYPKGQTSLANIRYLPQLVTVMKTSNILAGLSLVSFVSSAALAQSSVSVYGVADAAVESASAKGATTGADISLTRLRSQGSYLGFRGTESLGGGLSAVFQLEGNYSIDTGESTFFNRDTFVGLRSSQWGGVTLGVNTTPMRALGNSLDLTPGGNTGIGAIQSMLSINRQSTGADNRRTDSARYRSPTFNGFSFDAVYGFGEQRDAISGRNDNMLGAGVSYRNDKLMVGYAYDRQNDSNRTGLAQNDGVDTRHRLGAKYKVLPALELGAFYDTASSSGRFGPGAGTGKISKDTWGLIGEWTSGQHEAYAMFVKSDAVDCTGTTTGNGVACASAADTDARMFTLGYNYNLSKRTMIRAAISRIDNGRAARYDFSNGTVGATAGADVTGYSIGLRHRF